MKAREIRSFSGYNRRTFTAEEKEQFKLQTRKNLDSFYQNTAAKTLAMLKNNQEGTGMASLALPYNPATGTIFTGANSWILSQHMVENKLTDPRFVKSNQIKRMGEKAHIIKGEKGTHILEPRKIEKPTSGQTSEELDKAGLSFDEQDAIFENAKGSSVIMFRPYSVFHASQIKNMPQLNSTTTQELEPSKLAERLVEACGIKLAFGSDKPTYTLGNDTIHMPGKRKFDSPDAYAAALLKQWYVATGSKAREGRFKGPNRISEGLLNQAAEDLRSQCFSLVASQTFGLPYEMSIQPIYVKCWEKQLSENPKHIVVQTAHATNLVNMVVDFAKGVQPKEEWFPDQSTWPSEFLDLDIQLDETMAQGSDIANRIQEIVVSHNQGFVFEAKNDSLQFACDIQNDDDDVSTVAAAFEIRANLQREFPGLEVNVLQDENKILLSIGELPSQDLDLGMVPKP